MGLRLDTSKTVNWVLCTACFVERLCHPLSSAELGGQPWGQGSQSGLFLGNSGFIIPSLGNEEEENGVRHFSVEGVTQRIKSFNTQLPRFLKYLSTSVGDWLQGSLFVCKVAAPPLKCLLVYSLIANQFSNPEESPIDTHVYVKGGGNVPWPCDYRWRGIQQADSSDSCLAPGSASVTCGLRLCAQMVAGMLLMTAPCLK